MSSDAKPELSLTPSNGVVSEGVLEESDAHPAADHRGRQQPGSDSSQRDLECLRPSQGISRRAASDARRSSRPARQDRLCPVPSRQGAGDEHCAPPQARVPHAVEGRPTHDDTGAGGTAPAVRLGDGGHSSSRMREHLHEPRVCWTGGFLCPCCTVPVHAVPYADADDLARAATLLWGCVRSHAFVQGNAQTPVCRLLSASTEHPLGSDPRAGGPDLGSHPRLAR
jgi:hypothetical protein